MTKQSDIFGGVDKTPIVPRVHLNGTSRNELCDQLEGACNALRAALRELRQAAPNARDYYVIDSGAYARAADQHEDRERRVSSVLDELEAIWIELSGAD